MAVIAADVPLKGYSSERLGRALGPGEASKLVNTWREAGELRSRPGFIRFDLGASASANPVLGLFSADFGTGSKKLLRIDKSKIYDWTNSGGSGWTDISGAFTLGGGNTDIPSGCVANNRFVFGTGVAADRLYTWDGAAGAILKATSAGVIAGKGLRYVAAFAGRIIAGYSSGANGSVEIIGNERELVDAWVAANGAFSKFTSEHPSSITGLTSNDNELLVWKQRAVLRGVETGNKLAPIDFSLIQAEGLGLLAQRLAVPYAGSWIAYGQEGIYALSGGTPNFFDQDIRKELRTRANWGAIRNAFAVVMPEYGKILFFIPEGTSATAFPQIAWVFDFVNSGWDRWETSSQFTAAARAFVSDDKVVNAYDSAYGTVNSGTLSNLIVNTLGQPSEYPTYVFGDVAGATWKLDFNTDADPSGSFALTWETPDVRWEGLRDTESGMIIDDFDVVAFDYATVEYTYQPITGTSASLDVYYSINGGATYTLLTTKTLTATSGFYTKLDIFGRFSGDYIRLKFQINQVFGRPAFRNLTLYGKHAGERR